MATLFTFLFGIMAHVLLLIYALIGWVLVLMPTFRHRVDAALMDLLGEETAKDLLENHGPSFAHGEPALSFWWISVKFQLIITVAATIFWALLFKLMHTPGPVWLQTFTLKGILATQAIMTVLYVLASAITMPADPDNIDIDANHNQ